MKVCALIAAYNEAPTIAAVVRGVSRHLSRVVVVDDGSTDGTGEAAEAAGAEVLRHAANKGKGMAVRTGLAAILSQDFTHVLFLDGDLQHSPDEALQLIEACRTGAGELVIGERRFARGMMPLARYYANTISSWLISRFLIGAQVSDTQSGFRLIRADLLRRLELSSRGYEIETEILIKLARRGTRIDRIPITLRYEGTHSKLRPVRDTTRTCVLAVCYRFFPERQQSS